MTLPAMFDKYGQLIHVTSTVVYDRWQGQIVNRLNNGQIVVEFEDGEVVDLLPEDVIKVIGP